MHGASHMAALILALLQLPTRMDTGDRRAPNMQAN